MSKLEIIALSGVVYSVKSTGPSIERCCTPYESVTLSDRVSLIFTNWCLFSDEKRTKFGPAPIFHTNLKVYLLMQRGQWCRKRPTSQARSEM